MSSLKSRESSVYIYSGLIRVLRITEPANTGITSTVETFQVEVTCPEETEEETEGTPAPATPPPEKACD